MQNIIAKTSLSNRYYLMRHGESLANRRGIIVSAPENAIDDYGLTARGAEQVMQAALNTRLDRNAIIVSSDFKRARETAEIMQNVIDTVEAIQFDTKLRERGFGQFELQPHDAYETVWANDVSHPNKSRHKVETVEATLQRANKAIGDVLQILLAHHHSINPRFHRSLKSIANADIRSLSKLELNVKTSA